MHDTEKHMNWSRLLSLGALVILCLVLLTPVAQGQAETTTYKTYEAYKATVGARSFISSNRRNPRLLTDAQFAGRLDAGTTLIGIYYGNQGWQLAQVRDMESWQGKAFAVLSVITNWCDSQEAMDRLFAAQLVNIWDNHNVPLISWEPNLCSEGQTPGDVEVRAAQGRYDRYIETWADRLKIFLSGPDGVFGSRDDRRAYLRMAHEMNGDWYRWGAPMGRNRPADYIAMWKRVRGIFDAKGLDPAHVQWMWCVNHTDNGGFAAEAYYPGDEYVDWVAVDGYNWGETESWSDWTPPPGVYDAMIRRLRALTGKPLAIPEYATTSVTASGPDVGAKSQWIADAHAYVLAGDIRMVVWFNEDKETDWMVFGGSSGDGAYVGDGVYRPSSLAERFPVWQIAGAVLLVTFIMAEAVFVVRLL